MFGRTPHAGCVDAPLILAPSDPTPEIPMQDPYNLTGYRALVTGSSQGIGLGIAELLADRGANVILHSESPAACERAANSIARAKWAAWDLFDARGCDAFVQRVTELAEGKLDLLVHNAAICPGTALEDQSLEEWQRVQRINVEAAFQLTRAFAPLLAKSAHAAIVIVSSVVTRIGLGDSPAYTSSKAALIGLGRHLAAELGPKGIRVNMVLPGLVDTPGARASHASEFFSELPRQRQMIPIPIQPEDIAHAAVFLLSRAARAITAACLDVNGGMAVGG